jgi:hypothetical protein
MMCDAASSSFMAQCGSSTHTMSLGSQEKRNLRKCSENIQEDADTEQIPVSHALRFQTYSNVKRWKLHDAWCFKTSCSRLFKECESMLPTKANDERCPRDSAPWTSDANG